MLAALGYPVLPRLLLASLSKFDWKMLQEYRQFCQCRIDKSQIGRILSCFPNGLMRLTISRPQTHPATDCMSLSSSMRQ